MWTPEAREAAAAARQEMGNGAHQSMVKKVLASGDVHQAMAHAVTGYDRRQQAMADRSGRYYNPNALGHYLGAVQRINDDIKAGVPHGTAINNHTNGAIANTLHKALGTGQKAPKY